jgi:CBS domain-containing protein
VTDQERLDPAGPTFDAAGFLRGTPPFDALEEPELERIAAAARVVDHPAGAEILDGFARVADDLSVVLSGQVELWTADERTAEPDDVLGPGGVFGYLGLLSETPVGPRVVALGPVRILHVPRSVVAAVFSSPSGVRLLAREVSAGALARGGPWFRTVDELVVSAPVVGDAGTTVSQAAKIMTDRRSGYLAVPGPDGTFGLVTDAVLRERVLAAGLPLDTPVREVMIEHAPTARTGTPTADVLLELTGLTERGLDHLLVVDAAGRLCGAVDPQDFLASPSAAGVLLREQVRRARDVDQVVDLARRLPRLVGDLVRQRREATETTAVLSTVVDEVLRRVLSFVLAAHPDLDEAEVTWMQLGSNARREPVLGSDIDSAVVFAESVDTPARATAYRAAFAEVTDVLGRAGLRVDAHGATPGRAAFARTRTQWRRAAQEWLESPLDNRGMLMASLLLDGRPVQGDPAESAVHEVFADVRDHPGTMRLLLRESLSHRARLRSVRDVLSGRGGTFDLKAHALRPVVEIARWAALSVRSPELTTRARLMAASGSLLLPTEQAQTLVEVFEVLQRIRLRHQLAQHERGDRVSDVVWMTRLAPLDRSLVAQSVREIAAVQKRLFNLVQYTYPEEWA